MRTPRHLALLALVLVSAAWAASADRAEAAPRYAIRGLGLGPNSYAWGLNTWGVVVGSRRTSSSARAFVWSRRAGARYLPSVTGDWTEAYGINDRGDVVGVSQPDAVLWRSDGRIFRIPAGTISEEPCESSLFVAGLVNDRRLVVGDGAGDCDPSGTMFTWDASHTTTCHTTACPNYVSLGFDLGAGGLTEDGRIVGGSGYYSDPLAQPFIYGHGTFTWLPLLLNLPGVSVGSASSVTPDGSLIVGWSTKLVQAPYQTANRAVEWSGPSHSVRNLTPRLSQPWDDSAADSVNEAGTILLHYYDYGSSSFAFRLRTPAGHLYPIDALIPNPGRWTSIQPIAINDRGVIIGEAIRNGTPRAVILTPLQPKAGTVPLDHRAGPAIQRLASPPTCHQSAVARAPLALRQALLMAETAGCN
jgi:hypothetical protein